MKAQLKIAIVGYGIAGIAAAIQLRRRGHVIEHFERRNSAKADGGGLLLQPPAQRLLLDLGVGAEQLGCAARVDSFGAENLQGRTLTNIHYADHASGCHALGIQRRALIDCLRRQDEGFARVNFDRAVVCVDDENGFLYFSDGSQHGPYDLIVAADGANSPLRKGVAHLLRQDHLYPSAALVACIDDTQRLAGNRLIQVFDGARHVAIWPVGRLSRDQPDRANVSINIPLDRAENYRESGAWKKIVVRHFPKLALPLDGLADGFRPILYAYRDVELHRFMEGRLVFIGDAAHSMSPLLGQGARMAMLDASMLAQSLDSYAGLSAALRGFDQRARSKVPEFQRISRWLTPLFQSENRMLVAARQILQLAHRVPFVAAGARDLLISR